MRLHGLLLGVALSASLTPAQEQLTEKLIRRATAAADAGRDELAAALGRRARRSLADVKFRRRVHQLDKRVLAIVRAADSGAARVLKARDRAAKDLVAVAQSCVRARWHVLAGELVERASALSPVQAWPSLQDRRPRLAATAKEATAMPAQAAGETRSRRLLDEAQLALAGKRREQAALALLTARDGLRWAEAGTRAELGAEIDQLASRISHAGRAFRTLTKAAAALRESAERYQARGWKRTAVALLRTAQDCDAGLVTAALEAASEQAGSRYIGLLDATYDFFFLADNVTGEGRWAIEADRVASPGVATNDSVLLISRKQLTGNARIQLQASASGGPCCAGLIFGYKHRQDYFVLELNHADDKTWIQILRRVGTKFEKLAYGWLELGEHERLGPFDLWVELEDGRIRASVADRVPPLEADVQVESFDGSLGLYVHSASTKHGGVVFRGLYLETR